MAWRISPPLSEILSKGGDNACITRDEELTLLRRDLYSRETYALMETANRLSRDQFNGKGENHFHIGIMRRINFPGSPMERYGMISELEMARMVAASRLVMADIPRAQCTHEPHAVSLMAGANLFFPEMWARGKQPRQSNPSIIKNIYLPLKGSPFLPLRIRLTRKWHFLQKPGHVRHDPCPCHSFRIKGTARCCGGLTLQQLLDSGGKEWRTC